MKKALTGPSAARLSDPDYAYVAPFFIETGVARSRRR